MRPLLAAVGGCVLALLSVAPAGAHAERVGSDPEEGARVARAPETIAVDFSEPPISNPRFIVRDGCGEDVTERVDVDGLTIRAPVSVGEPGAWNVRFRVVSGVDGHPTSGSFRFTVVGRAECGGERAGTNEGPSRPPDEEAAPFPAGILIAAGLGVMVLAAVALAVRRSGGE